MLDAVHAKPKQDAKIWTGIFQTGTAYGEMMGASFLDYDRQVQMNGFEFGFDEKRKNCAWYKMLKWDLSFDLKFMEMLWPILESAIFKNGQTSIRPILRNLGGPPYPWLPNIVKIG